MTELNSRPLSSRVAIGALWMVAVRFASRTLGLLSTLVIARILAPADFGLVAMATAFSQSVNAFSEVGVAEALVRHPDEATALYDTAFTMQAIRGLLTAAVVAAAAPFAGHWFGEPRLAPVLLVLAALAALSGFENIAVVEFRRNLRFDVEFALQILPRALQVAVAVAAALLLHSYWALLIALSASKLSRLVATYAVRPHRPRLTLGRWRDLFGFSFWSWACSMASIAWLRSDAFVVTPVLGVAVFGLYSLAWEIGGLPVSEFIAPVATALFPGFAEARRRGDKNALAPMAVVAFLTLLIAPLAIALSAAAGPVVLVLLGPRWLAARPLVAVIAIICAVSPFGWVSASLLSASGRVARYFVVIAFSAAVRVLMLLYAVRGGDVLSVAWWSVASLFFEATVFAIVLRLSGELRLRDGLGGMVRTFLASAVTLAALWASGLGWRDAASTRVLPAIVEGAGIGLVTIAVFAAAIGVIWRLAGAPEGPETRFAGMLRPLIARIGRHRPA
jgi:lipopolysaccharide exporter